jgi:ectoine hydroxylase-related dioxygenase (phytanoyl-CoA dioxygenase family)
MSESTYQKVAGTAAVFLMSDYTKASPVERDGMHWTAKELHLEKLPEQRQQKAAMPNALALEGLEDYEPPENGDLRFVESIGKEFMYFGLIRGWVQVS